MATTLALSTFASTLNAAHYGLSESSLEDVKRAFLTLDARADFARTLLRQEQELFAIPETSIDLLALKLTDPANHAEASREILSYGFSDPNVTFAGTGAAVVMERVYGDLDPTRMHVALVPAGWSLDVMLRDSDLSEEGRFWYHWVAHRLPSIPESSEEEPLNFVLMSEEFYGTLRWGGFVLDFYRGKVTLTPETQRGMLDMLLLNQGVAV